MLRSQRTWPILKNLVFIGDSLTQWGDWEQRFPGYQVTNLGISGETAEGLLARRERIRAQIDDPGFIFLMTGINNIATGQYDIIPLSRDRPQPDHVVQAIDCRGPKLVAREF